MVTKSHSKVSPDSLTRGGKPSSTKRKTPSAARVSRLKRTVSQSPSRKVPAKDTPVDQVSHPAPAAKTSWQQELSQAAVVASSAWANGQKLSDVARQTVQYVGQQPAILEAFSRAVSLWESRHSNDSWAKEAPSSFAKALGQAANVAAGSDAAALMHAGVEGLETNGVLGAVANLSQRALQIHGSRLTPGEENAGLAAKASATLAKVAKAVPGVTSVEGLGQGVHLGANLISAIDGLKFVQKLQKHDVSALEQTPAHIRAANVIRAAAEIALWYFQSLRAV